MISYNRSIEIWVDQVAREADTRETDTREADATGNTTACTIPCFSPDESGENARLMNRPSPLSTKRRRCLSAFPSKRHQRGLAPADSNHLLLSKMAPKKNSKASQKETQEETQMEKRRSPRIASSKETGSTVGTSGKIQATTRKTGQGDARSSAQPPAAVPTPQPPATTPTPQIEMVSDPTWVGSLALREPTPSNPPKTTSLFTTPSQEFAKNRYELFGVNISSRVLASASLPRKAKDLLDKIDRIGSNHEIIPSAIRERFSRSILTNSVAIEDREILPEYHLDQSGALFELSCVEEVLTDAMRCQSETECEASWNVWVHSRVFKIALDGTAGRSVKAWVTTNANIIPKFAPKIMSPDGDGEGKSVFKMIDFCLTIEPKDAIQVYMINQSMPAAQRSINQSLYTPLTGRPIAIAVETKIETSTTTSETQLGIWTKAWLNRMCLLRGQHMNTDPSSPPLPLISIRGPLWYVQIAFVENGRLEIMGKKRIGDTESLRGLYQLLKSIRTLVDWVEGDFRHYIDEVVIPEATTVWVEGKAKDCKNREEDEEDEDGEDGEDGDT